MDDGSTAPLVSAWRPVLDVRAVGYCRHIGFGANALVFGAVFVGKHDAFLAGARHVLLESDQFAILGVDESLLEWIRRGAFHPLPEDVFEIVRVVHERGVPLVADILAHVQKMRVDDVDSLLVHKLLQCACHFSAPVLADDKRICRHEALGGVRQCSATSDARGRFRRSSCSRDAMRRNDSRSVGWKRKQSSDTS